MKMQTDRESNLTNFIKRKVELMSTLGLVDNQLTVDEYVNTIKKIIKEQEDKNIITDRQIDYNDEISSIEELGELETIDISVTGDNLFYCNDILTKNSIGLAATADVIVSIFQNDEDRELELIRMGMMKNRFGARGTTTAMKIDYSTLTITQSDDAENIGVDSQSLSNLSMFAS
jgi:hypothetical protein